MLAELNHLLSRKQTELGAWLTAQRQQRKLPIYASVDVRDAGFKAGIVDANFFPAGFNNIAQADRPELISEMTQYLSEHHVDTSHVHIFPEAHTRNPGYIENVLTLTDLLLSAGMRVTVGSPQLNGYPLLAGISAELKIDEVAVSAEDELQVEGTVPDLILLNHDLTGGRLSGLGGEVTPPVDVGWQQRRKSDHFTHLSSLISEVAGLLEIDEWLLSPMWLVSEDRCLEEDPCKIMLAAQINDMITNIAAKYEQYGVDREPMIYIKNDRGTYGLGILAIKNGEQILNLSRRSTKKLTYGKGGQSAENFLIQEGIPTAFSNAGAAVEPVGYTIGGHRSAWFFRVNKERDEMGNLNSPAASFLIRDRLEGELSDEIDGCADWHELLASLSYLAMADEIAAAALE